MLCPSFLHCLIHLSLFHTVLYLNHAPSFLTFFIVSIDHSLTLFYILTMLRPSFLHCLIHLSFSHTALYLNHAPPFLTFFIVSIHHSLTLFYILTMLQSFLLFFIVSSTTLSHIVLYRNHAPSVLSLLPHPRLSHSSVYILTLSLSVFPSVSVFLCLSFIHPSDLLPSHILLDCSSTFHKFLHSSHPLCSCEPKTVSLYVFVFKQVLISDK